MDLSIIIPCYNLEKHIAPLISTLNGQQVFDYQVEVIFMLDSCTDNTRGMIEQLWNGPQYASMKIYDCHVHSCGLAREEGRKYATGKYTWFVDGDDWLLGMWVVVKILHEFANAPDMPMLRLGYVVPNYFQAKGYYSMVWQYVFKSEFIADIHFGNDQPHEDIGFMDQVVKKLDNGEILDVEDCLYYYNYFREGSVMRTYLEAHPKE